jgi:preprotein translocase subunit YajC
MEGRAVHLAQPLAAESSSGGSYLPILVMVLLIAGLYFLMIRPQQRRRREAEQLISQLGVGDEVMTGGGLYGTIVSMDDETVTLEVSPGVTNRYLRRAIMRVVTPGGASVPSDRTDGQHEGT